MGNGFYWAAGICFFLGITLLISFSQRARAFAVPAALSLTLALVCAYRFSLKRFTDPELAHFFESGTNCTLVMAYIQNETSAAIGHTAENVCYIMTLKKSLKQFPVDEQVVKILSAAQLLKKHQRLNSTELMLLMTVDIATRVSQKKNAIDAQEKIKIAAGMSEDMLALIEIFPVPSSKQPGQSNFEELNAQLARKGVAKIVLKLRETIEKLKSEEAARFPAAAQVPESPWNLLQARLSTIENSWNFSQAELEASKTSDEPKLKKLNIDSE